jgi:UDP-N-acetylglucosamine--N-acetylmuramyl-(pentapeptide) pyrophosphoryl-undecaprenol N-acetylglucosamine transferase
MLSKYADCIGVSFKNSEAYFTKAKRVVYTGNPCGELAKKQETKDLSEFGFKKSDKVIIIVAGSLGSESFNNKFKAYLSMIGNESYKVLYIAGKNYYEEFMKDNNFSKNVKVIPYYDNLSSILGSAYLIISRAGASTLSEIVALKKPSILIPSPYVANNHQYYNALDLANIGVAELIEEKNLNANMIQVAINELVYNKDKYNEMLKNLDKMNEKSSSNIIYNTIKELIK